MNLKEMLSKYPMFERPGDMQAAQAPMEEESKGGLMDRLKAQAQPGAEHNPWEMLGMKDPTGMHAQLAKWKSAIPNPMAQAQGGKKS